MSSDSIHFWAVVAVIAGVALTFTARRTSPGDDPGSAAPGSASNAGTSPVTASPETRAPTTAASPAGMRVGGVPFPVPAAGTCHVGSLNGQPLP